MRVITLVTCQLNQWALDFVGNKKRILESIAQAKALNASFRTGPELEICGYGCNDHFLEPDTFQHSQEVLADILADKTTYGMLLDIGMPVIHKGVRYNCRVFIRDGKIIMIRPKKEMAMDGNYRESRWFTPWKKPRVLEDHLLGKDLQKVTGQINVPLGDGIITTYDASFGSETCEELFTPQSPHIDMCLDGVEIIANGSGSHHELRKLNTRVDLMLSASGKLGGVYMYANQQGCDGERVYYDGCAMICMNGKVLAQASQFSLSDVEVISATVDLDEVSTYRASMMSRTSQAARSENYPKLKMTDYVCADDSRHRTEPIPVRYHTPEEEIALGPACWMWDYLRRCRLGGFFLPLSGGIDSSSTACLVASMCRLVCKACAKGDTQVLADARYLAKKEGTDYIPTDPKEFASHVFYTCYMGTSNSSKETQERAKLLASEIGAYHTNINIDTVVESIVSLFELATGKRPQYKVHGGSHIENIALQNIQARLRMLFSYLCASLLPWIRPDSSQRGLLVLGSANVDESLRGYLTKYDCSSADINPIGGISKADLRKFIQYSIDKFQFDSLQQILDAPPTAELEPITDTYTQTDEEDMGMSYDDLTQYGRLRKIFKCGPYTMYEKLSQLWSHLPLQEIATKVQFFFRMYGINRHKLTVLTPSYHAENYSPDDNRFDLRPFLYPNWQWQFQKINDKVRSAEDYN